MDDRKYFLDLRFMRIFSHTGSWVIIGPGLFFLFGFNVSSAKIIGGFLLLIAIIMVVFAVSGKSLKTGYYSRNRIILLAFTGILVLISALTFKVFFLFSNQTYWLGYFLGIVGFLILSAVALVRSVQKGRNLDSTQTE